SRDCHEPHCRLPSPRGVRRVFQSGRRRVKARAGAGYRAPLRVPAGFWVEKLEADQAAADGEERFVDVVAAFVSDPQLPVLVQPGDGALDDPTLLAESGAMRGLGSGDLRLDAAPPQLAAALARVVGAVAVQLARAPPRTAAASTDRRDRDDGRAHLGGVVSVPAR